MAAENWIDISVPLYTGMVHWPDNPPVHIERTMAIENGDGCNLSKMSMGVHTGTHVDAPIHFVHGGRGIHAVPFEALIGPARVIEITDPHTVTAGELRQHDIQQGERLLLKTLNSTRCWKTNNFVEDFVYVEQAAAQYLADLRLQTLGVDYLSVGGFTRDGAETHQALLTADVWVIEGLNLSAISAGSYDLICLPLRIVDSDGAPARAVLRK